MTAEPNEGSDLCPACIDVIRAEPFGREFASAVQP